MINESLGMGGEKVDVPAIMEHFAETIKLGKKLDVKFHAKAENHDGKPMVTISAYDTFFLEVSELGVFPYIQEFDA